MKVWLNRLVHYFWWRHGRLTLRQLIWERQGHYRVEKGLIWRCCYKRCLQDHVSPRWHIQTQTLKKTIPDPVQVEALWAAARDFREKIDAHNGDWLMTQLPEENCLKTFAKSFCLLKNTAGTLLHTYECWNFFLATSTSNPNSRYESKLMNM